MAEHAESDESELSLQEPLHPWGKRTSFRAMLDGGNKLVLADTPPAVSNFFKKRVFRSHGCTYDDRTLTFFATEPGRRGEDNGMVIAMGGMCKEEPYRVADGLDEPAAIAVYQPGESLCVVTNRGIFVLTRRADDKKGARKMFAKRQISFGNYHRGICVSAGGGIVSFCRGKIYMYDGDVEGREKVLAEANYDKAINEHLFTDNPGRRNSRSNCCFMDIVGDQLVMSDLQKHVISLWQVVDAAPHKEAAITFVGAIDVAMTCNPWGSMGMRGDEIPDGKLAYASGIRLDAEGWVLCADADGRNLMIFDDRLQFVTRIEPASPRQLPYISGLYMDINGHLMVCDRKNEMGGLCVFIIETRPSEAKQREEEERREREQDAAIAAAAAACAAPYLESAARYPARAAASYQQPRAAAAVTPYQTYSSHWEPVAKPAPTLIPTEPSGWYGPTPGHVPRHIPTEPAAYYEQQQPAAPAARYSAAAPYQSAARYPPMDTPYLPNAIPDYYAGNYLNYQR